MTNLEAFPTSLEDLFGLRGKVALVLGGGFGMGEESSNWLAHAGCEVIVADLSAERAEKVVRDIRSRGRRAFAAVGDLTDAKVVDALLTAAEAELGGIDVVVSVIGQAGWYSFLDATVDQWRADQQRNLEFFVFASQWAARSMVRRQVEGSICAIASVDGLQGSPMHSGYGAAKAGMISLVKSMAVELGRYGIRVNCIAPGSINTPRTTLRRSAEDNDDRCRAMGIPLGRAGTIREVASTAVYLVSDLAKYVTGVCLPLDGGWMASRIDGAKYTNPPEGLPANPKDRA